MHRSSVDDTIRHELKTRRRHGGGTVGEVTATELRAARRRVENLLVRMEGATGTFVERARSVQRAQPHLLDEVLYALFERRSPDSSLSDAERAEIYRRVWVAIEAVAGRWTPPEDFVGEEAYRFTPVD